MGLGSVFQIIPIILTLAFYGFLLWVVYKIVTTLSRIADTVDEIRTILRTNTGRTDVHPQ